MHATRRVPESTYENEVELESREVLDRPDVDPISIREAEQLIRRILLSGEKLWETTTSSACLPDCTSLSRSRSAQRIAIARSNCVLALWWF